MLLLCSFWLIFAQDYNYTNFNGLINKYQTLETLYPSYVNAIEIGQSHSQHQPIKSFKITNENNNNLNKKNILLIGSVYAKDIVSAHLLYSWTNDLLANHNSTMQSNFLNEANIWIIPSLNPDGLDISLSLQNFDLLGNGHDNNNDNIYTPLVDGVNLNRNFSFNWIHGNTYSFENNYQFRGKKALSETESIALNSFLTNNKIDFALVFISDNNLNNQILFPYEWYSVRKSPDYYAFNQIAENLTQHFSSDNVTWSKSANQIRNGNLIDYLYVSQGILPFQLSLNYFNSLPDSSSYNQLKNQVIGGLNQFLNITTNYATQTETLPGLLDLTVTNAQNNQFLDAEIVINEIHTSAFSNNHANLINGKFLRYLANGNYNLIIKKKGYEPYSLNVEINNNQTTSQTINLVPIPQAQLNISLKFESQPHSGTVILELNSYSDTLNIQSGFTTFNGYSGNYDITVINDSLAPITKSTFLNSGQNNILINLTYANTALTEEFDGSCCSWILNGPWLVVQDSSHNSHFITDSWSGNGFYLANSDNNLQSVSAINLFGYDNQDVYLCFEHAVYTEWDNDYVTVEISIDGSNWISLYKFAGITNGWQKEVINLNQYINNDFYLRFRIKDGSTGNPNHPELVDPGWNIDNIKILAGTGSVSNDEAQIPSLKALNLKIYPNPFNPLANISFDSPKDFNSAQVSIYNIKGQLIESIILSSTQMKNKQFQWNASKFASGIYFVRLSLDNKLSITKKTLLLK